MAGGWHGASIWRCSHCGCGKTAMSEAWCKRCSRHWKTGKPKKTKGKGKDVEPPPGLFSPGAGGGHGSAPRPVGLQGAADPAPELSVAEIKQL
eukprot:6091768-Pyramimonas_sp.AAC.1